MAGLLLAGIAAVLLPARQDRLGRFGDVLQGQGGRDHVDEDPHGFPEPLWVQMQLRVVIHHHGDGLHQVFRREVRWGRYDHLGQRLLMGGVGVRDVGAEGRLDGRPHLTQRGSTSTVTLLGDVGRRHPHNLSLGWGLAGFLLGFEDALHPQERFGLGPLAGNRRARDPLLVSKVTGGVVGPMAGHVPEDHHPVASEGQLIWRLLVAPIRTRQMVQDRDPVRQEVAHDGAVYDEVLGSADNENACRWHGAPQWRSVGLLLRGL